MNRVFLLRPSEDWIVDRIVQEWYQDNSDISTLDPRSSDVIWLAASWCYKNIDRSILKSKKVITTVHHIVEEKFDDNKLREFLDRDELTTVYHVPNFRTESFLRKITKKPIEVIPYWANQKIWKKTGNKKDLRKKYGIPEDAYVIGSFQRDTEGFDLSTPKLEKGPDLLVNYLEKIKSKDLFVVLAGWRRQYVIRRLESLSIKHAYFDRPDQAMLNNLYQCLDLYPVTSRCEGGPQSLIECGLLDVPVVSRPVGIAEIVLNDASISDDVLNATPGVPQVENLKLPSGYSSYRNLIKSL
jgi:hypothetical protein